MFRKKILFTLIFVFLCLQGCATHLGIKDPDWTHLELGAGNYGEDGHTKTSLQMTVLKALTFVSTQPNFIDQLPEHDIHEYKPEEQYQVLFWTLDHLVQFHGDKGVFHVNDLYADYSDFAAEKLRNYAKQKGYDSVKIESIPGDYAHIMPSDTLARYNRTHYDSVHLKNPEISFYHHGLDGDKVVTNKETRARSRALLQTLANFSKKGLYFFPIDYRDYFIPKAEKAEFINKGIFYRSTNEWEAVPYVFPTGQVLDKKYGRVFFIQAS